LGFFAVCFGEDDATAPPFVRQEVFFVQLLHQFVKFLFGHGRFFPVCGAQTAFKVSGSLPNRLTGYLKTRKAACTSKSKVQAA